MADKVIIKIEGRLGEHWREWFDDMDISYDGNTTILTGVKKDEAHIHGILNKIRNLNMKLISVNPYDEK